ncbi:MAG: orotate phosphoribosyltransferase [Atribacter sp.]|jgi:orotate phosphoribosyltransferase|uniref:orotate phosphoribosyltransferase n=1 Tax=Atribacter sp. TaxID=2847780 RepID=UPI0017510E72|nr:orotate phosphoribosyltransferase [Atribacterota bacterium]HHT11003.1 orotate phosphoribosyltransferase [Candidatus Atribacteria bacterium]
MREQEILQLFREAGAFMEGHFLLTSGLHSPFYIEKFKLLQRPKYVELLAGELIERFSGASPDVVVGPAIGGIILAYEVARQLGIRMAFTERENGKMKFRRDFVLEKNNSVLVVEDVVTTGSSAQEVIDVVEETGAKIIGVGILVDRSGGKIQFKYPFHPLLQMEVMTYLPDECPLCQEHIELQKRGSRNLSANP